jgi:16S rRNA G966 N2-methylase RsmD
MSRDLFTGKQVKRNTSVLSERFDFPPFSVFSAREGDWQNLKRYFIELGIQSELGRGEALTWTGEDLGDIDFYRHGGADAKTYGSGGPGTLSAEFKKRKRPDSSPGGSAMPAMDYSKRERGRGDGKPIVSHPALPGRGTSANPSERNVYSNFGHTADKIYDKSTRDKETASLKGGLALGTTIHPYDAEKQDYQVETGQTGTSIFDPVITYIFYKWFTPKNGIILDPFAGGSVRGIVASVLGRGYVGVDLRPEQVAANKIQAETICSDKFKHPKWIVGDSLNIRKLVKDVEPEGFDGIFSCPPYFDLEQYSEDERDLSNMSRADFEDNYFKIINRSVKLLKDNRFACFVIGEVRDKTGEYMDLYSLTTQCFKEAGCRYYNRAILITAVGSLPLRVQRQFIKSGKLGNTHQDVIIFVKGDEREAWKATEPKVFKLPKGDLNAEIL